MPDSKSWWRAQAEAQRQSSQRNANENEAKQFLTALFEQHAKLQQRVIRLAAAYADRCARVHELMGLYRQEWERAEAAEERLRELESTIEPKAIKSKANGKSVASTSA